MQQLLTGYETEMTEHSLCHALDWMMIQRRDMAWYLRGWLSRTYQADPDAQRLFDSLWHYLEEIVLWTVP